MKKTITANIGGRIFNIEEVAFEKLNNYLSTIRRYFGDDDSADEINNDIELRLAELFQERLTAVKQVIDVTIVDEVIAIMGRPEEFAQDDDNDADTKYEAFERKHHRKKRIFRDPDNRVLAGVCSGISAYFGWDPIVLRLIFAVTFIFFGSGLLLYIILAIIIPTAKTTAEKLQMHGEPVTVENISKKVTESMKDIGEDLKDFGKKNDINEARLKQEGRRIEGFLRQLGHYLLRFITVLGAILARVIGAVLFIAALAVIILLLSLLLGWNFVFQISEGNILWDEHLQLIFNSVFDNDLQQTLFFWGLVGFVFLPLTGLLITGMRLLFDLRRLPSYVGIFLSTLWTISVVLLVYSGIKLQKEFQVEANYNETVEMHELMGEVLTISAEESAEPKYRFKGGLGQRGVFLQGIVTFPGIDSSDLLYTGRNKITIEMNEKDDQFRLELKRSSKGATQKDAIHNASVINTRHTMSGDSLSIFPWFALKRDQKIRAQKSTYILFVPVGKSVHFSKNAEEVIYDIANVTNTVDKDMVGKTWMMTRNGLTCISCDTSFNTPNDTLQQGAF